MKLVLLTALGVGGATILGTILGFVFKNISHRFSDIVLGFAAAVTPAWKSASMDPQAAITQGEVN